MKLKILIILLLLTIILSVHTTFAEILNKEAAGSLSILMEETRNNKSQSINSKDIVQMNPDKVIPLLYNYMNDPSPNVRYEAYYMGFLIAMKHSDINIRQDMTDHLVKGLNDSDSLVWQHAGKFLLNFNEADFSEATKLAIKKLLKKEKPRREDIRIVGIANMRDEMSRLKELLIDETKYDSSGMWYGSAGWAARLASARMGSKKDIDRAIELVENVPDGHTRVLSLLKDLVYIRQPEIIDVLKKYLESDKRLPGRKINDPGIRYCQYAIDFLAHIIEDFPVKKKKVGRYSQSEIDQARKWMKNKNNWINSIRR